MRATGEPEMLVCLRSVRLEQPSAAVRGRVEKLNGINRQQYRAKSQYGT